MGASKIDIWRHATNVVGRAAYGVNGKKHFELQKERMANMASGGTGGTLSSAIMTDTSGHEGTIRALHFADWEDGDFAAVLEIISAWEETGSLPPEPEDDSKSSVEEIVARAYDLLKELDRDARIEALNALAECLGVMEPDDDVK